MILSIVILVTDNNLIPIWLFLSLQTSQNQYPHTIGQVVTSNNHQLLTT